MDSLMSYIMPYTRRNAYTGGRFGRRRVIRRHPGLAYRTTRRAPVRRAPVRRRTRTLTSSLLTARSRASFRRIRR